MRTPQAAIVGQGMVQEAGGALGAVGRPDFSEGQSQAVVDGNRGDVITRQDASCVASELISIRPRPAASVLAWLLEARS